MPSTPTTKSQVQAYRFVLRRMQSALVRKDAVMLHDPMRTHSRATAVGFILGAIGVLGFVIVGLLAPKPTLPESGIIIAEPSGTVYVVSGNPKTLTPTFNLASARLLVLAQQNQGQSGGSENPDAPAQAPANPTVIDDKNLKDIPKRQLTGIPNGPQLLPAEDQRTSDNWAVCDVITLDRTLPEAQQATGIQTSVLAGVGDLSRELQPGESLLVQAENKKTYLVYRTPSNVNERNSNAVRAEVDLNKPSVVQALKLDKGAVRRISTGMLNAIPEVKSLTAPTVSGNGTSDLGVQVGGVFSVPNASNRDYYVVYSDGIEKIKSTTADLIRYEKSAGSASIPEISPDRITSQTLQDRIDDRLSPDVAPGVLQAQAAGNSVACLGWSLQGTGDARDSHTALHISAELPLPKDASGAKMQPLKIATPSADGQKIDSFFMPPGRAAVVRGSASKADFDRGPIYLVSDRGVKYGIPDTRTAGALGLDKQSPAPDAIVRLLPDGASLSSKDVNRSFDSVPFDPQAGTVNTPPAQPNQGGGS
ncbi:type VII secretion protein EccB [Actinosynnema sp. ALI-1.44]|uniref:type VII secretion protein EccB n=1 Tax=Actinosynnema sp. ALI-1.44 TaxID=1933779 RepID=UPI00097C9DFC|nr:type VII secretion protein EccB [Actinosynnema sp. ALI-1.44]ONI73354.1 type VII secretion protein EccB [Actinosynnema sp. ALI-1.44]